MTEAFESVLDCCVQRLIAGESIDCILMDYPAQADELRPLLQAALAALRPAQASAGSAAAQNRSRAAFLAAAGDSAPKASGWMGFAGFFRRFRMRTAPAMVIAGVAIGLVGTGFVSAQSLPGDLLYPVKIAVEQTSLSLTGNDSTHIEQEDTFEHRRSNEVGELLDREREAEVEFAGVLSGSNGAWSVAGIPIQAAGGLVIDPAWVDAYVEVEGVTDPSGFVQVYSVDLYTYQFVDRIQQQNGNLWQIGGIQVQVTSSTLLYGPLQPGDLVEAQVVRGGDGSYTAIWIQMGQSHQTYAPSTLEGEYAGETEDHLKIETPEAGSHVQPGGNGSLATPMPGVMPGGEPEHHEGDGSSQPPQYAATPESEDGEHEGQPPAPGSDAGGGGTDGGEGGAGWKPQESPEP